MNIVDYILEYIENKGVSYFSELEYTNMLDGIKLYLLENGIKEDESKKYYLDYVSKHLKTIEPVDLKDYFVCYPLISNVNQMVIESRVTPEIGEEFKNALLSLLLEIRLRNGADKYIPCDEVKRILGDDF